MTHSLHRLGSEENLKDDFVILVTPAVGINHENSREKLAAILDFIFSLEPNNIGSYETGTIYSGATIEEIKAQLSETPRVRCCFDSRSKVVKLLSFIRDGDFGLSVTLSGLTADVLAIAEELALKPHSINMSLGLHGRVEDLPDRSVLEHLTMCGHGMISGSLVRKQIEDVRRGKRTVEKAAEILARPCVCGIFNTRRSRELLEQELLAAAGEETEGQ